MRRIVAGVIVWAALPLVSAASDFDWLVRDFSHETGMQPLHIPLFGLVRFAVSVVQPAGTSELRLAVFEHARMDPMRFQALADHATAGVWKPMVRVRSLNGESTNIYAQTEVERLRLIIATIDKDDATFVQVRVKPQQLIRFVDERGWKKR